MGIWWAYGSCPFSISGNPVLCEELVGSHMFKRNPIFLNSGCSLVVVGFPCLKIQPYVNSWLLAISSEKIRP